jgi:hypothetical protein
MGHMPQVCVPPQPFGTSPQTRPMQASICGIGVQPHWFGVFPPPHVCGNVHVPQGTVPPQPLDAVPQF